MTTKNKSFLEDTFILFIIGVIIYAIYSFIFPSNDNEQIQEAKTTIEEKVENPLLNETIDSKMKNDENIFEEVKEENVLNTQEEPLPSQEEFKKEELKEEATTIKTEKKTEEKSSAKIDDLESFYENIRGSINKSIEATPPKSGENISIRFTILKDGRYEQLILLEGNKEYFNKIKSSIVKVFPLKVSDSLKSNFPRYFRMEIESN